MNPKKNYNNQTKKIMKIDIETITNVVTDAIKDNDLVQDLLNALINAQREKDSINQAAKPEKKDVRWEWVVYERNGSYWVLQVGENKCDKIDAIIEQVRNKFNDRRKKKDFPIIPGNVADCFECIPAKIWKEHDVRVKTKTQAFPYISK